MACMTVDSALGLGMGRGMRLLVCACWQFIVCASTVRRHHLTDDRALHLRHDDAVDGKSERI